MTRETKISLLVGLAFIIVIGILLSDHFRSTQELPQAVLADEVSGARRSTDVPGSSNPGITFVAPSETTPKESVPTHDELTTPPSPVVPLSHYNNKPQNDRPMIGRADSQQQDEPRNPIIAEAQRNGEPMEPANLNGTPKTDDGMTAPPAETPAPVAAGPRQYKAGDGDTVSRMAAKFLGGNTKANRDAIIDANPSLQDDPDRVIVGKTYNIHDRGDDETASNAPVAPRNLTSTASGAYFYTVKEGDSLWQIANNELEDPSAVDAIKDLNTNVLKGEQHDVVIPGMKLRLPAKPVADTTN